MIFSCKWLKEYLDELPDPSAIAERLTMTGTEIESVASAAPAVTGVITAEVLTKEKHPNADRLSLCEVSTGTGTHSIVCGAKNMAPGDKVPLALPGAVLPNGLKIKRSKIRGIESGGMMCSEVELGLADTSEGLLILPEDTPLGVDIVEALGLDDTLMEAGITPNRADLLSIRGIARELGAVTGKMFTDKVPVVEEGDKPVEDFVSVSIDAPEGCARYTARVIEGVTVGPTPEHIKRRLESLGVRSINNIVDVTNYVLFEMGQPLHAFDIEKIKGGTIRVRTSTEGETIETLDGVARKLETGMLVIADAESPVALAGVMGGASSEVSESTKTILLESAWFTPSVVRRSSRKAGLSTDSSYRFERGVDIGSVDKALDMAAVMIQELAGGVVARGTIDVYPQQRVPASIDFSAGRASVLLGIPVAASDAAEIFKTLGMEVSGPDGDRLTVTPPTYRMDITMQADLVEELARMTGYDKLPTTMPTTTLTPPARGPLHEVRNNIKEILTNDGFFEVVNYSFISPAMFSAADGLTGPEGRAAVRILNPLTGDQTVMRDSLIPSLLENLRKNIQFKNDEVRIFELATVFSPSGEGKLAEENWKATGLMYGSRWGQGWNVSSEKLDFYDVKGVVERLSGGLGAGSAVFTPLDEPGQKVFHPGKAATVAIGREPAGVLGELHPDMVEEYGLKGPAYIFELDAAVLLKASAGVKKYASLARFPASGRDIAIIVDEKVPFAEIISAIERLDTKLIERVELFDVYYGSNIPSGKRSLALRIVYRSTEGTLTQAQVEGIHSKVALELNRIFKAEVRGAATGA